MVQTSVCLALVCYASHAQQPGYTSVTARDVFTEFEAMASPLAEIASELDVIVTPRPFGRSGLSEACMAFSMPTLQTSLAVSALQTSSISLISPRVRYRFVPMDGYAMGLGARLDWMLVRGFENTISFNADICASMRIVEWTLAMGLENAISLASGRGPILRMGLARTIDSSDVMMDLIVRWDRPASLRLAVNLPLAERFRTRLALATSPVTNAWALRCVVSSTTDVAFDVRHVDPLGMHTALTIAVAMP
ncbi:MAG: hypothetical protein ACKOE4_01565 [Candidatus Kapaibacterium sp.]